MAAFRFVCVSEPLKISTIPIPSSLPSGTQDEEIVKDLDGGSLRKDLNEVMLLHGVSDLKIAFKILQNGMNERYSGKGAGSAFGEGAYLAGMLSNS
jgi:hypothetical protein